MSCWQKHKKKSKSNKKRRIRNQNLGKKEVDSEEEVEVTEAVVAEVIEDEEEADPKDLTLETEVHR